MPIPDFTIDGILPPFVGPDGPGASSNIMTPYRATAEEVVVRFGGTVRRNEILRGWLDHRAALRAAGVARGFQWVDGSFVEDKEPNDIDVLTYFHRPAGFAALADFRTWVTTNARLLNRAFVKQTYKVDFFPFDLQGSPEALVEATRYYGALFSHRRDSNLWKGMLSVRLEDPADDAAALAAITPPAAAGVVGAAP